MAIGNEGGGGDLGMLGMGMGEGNDMNDPSQMALLNGGMGDNTNINNNMNKNIMNTGGFG